MFRLQLLLEVLVHHVDHPVAEPPQQEQRTDQDERERQVTAAVEGEQACFGLLRGHAYVPFYRGKVILSKPCRRGVVSVRVAPGGAVRQTDEMVDVSP